MQVSGGQLALPPMEQVYTTFKKKKLNLLMLINIKT
jgi:hypothetical protein